MKHRCLACGIEKDRAVLERYPYAEEDGLIEDPIDPLIELDCQGARVEDRSEWRSVNVCHECFHKLEVDLWISEGAWNRLEPVTPFERLPKLQGDPK